MNQSRGGFAGWDSLSIAAADIQSMTPAPASPGQSRKSPDEIPPGASPLTGVVPPPEHRWRPGQSGNPKGRPRAAGSVRDQLNAMVAAGLTEDQARRIAGNRRLRWSRRAAALILVRLLERGDLADFAPLLSGEATLEQLRKYGVSGERARPVANDAQRISYETRAL